MYLFISSDTEENYFLFADSSCISDSNTFFLVLRYMHKRFALKSCPSKRGRMGGRREAQEGRDMYI